MKVERYQPQVNASDEAYWKIWEREMEQSKYKWNNTTFFLAISFAILGFSFQNNLASSTALIIRIFGLIIYWFAYFLYLSWHRYSLLLRTFLREIEATGSTSLNYQRKSDEAMRSNKIHRVMTTRWYLLSLGIVFTTGVILLSVLKL